MLMKQNGKAEKHTVDGSLDFPSVKYQLIAEDHTHNFHILLTDTHSWHSRETFINDFNHLMRHWD